MAMQASVFSALLFKPAALARDLAIVVIFGLGTITDSYYACITALTLAQGVVIGALGNHWIPHYIALDSESRRTYFFVTLFQSIRLGIWLCLLLCVLTTIATPHLSDFGRITEGFIVTLPLLAPTIPLIFLTSWIGNRQLADGKSLRAQAIFASHTSALLFMLALVNALSLPSTPEWLALYHLVAQLISTTLIGMSQFRDYSLWRNEPRRIAKNEGLRWTAYFVSISEAAIFGVLQTALVILPGNAIPGAGTLSGLVSRAYSAILSLVVSPASQGLLFQLNNSRYSTSILRNIHKLLLIIGALAIVGLITPMILSITAWEWKATTISELLFDFIFAYSIQFAAFGLIMVAARILAAKHFSYHCSIFLGSTYAIALGVMYGVHPLEHPTNYVLITSLLLLGAGSCLIFVAYWILKRD